MTRNFLFSLLSATALATMPMVAMAEDKTGENVQQMAEDAAPGVVSKAALAQDLFSHAQETKNAVAALAAAQIMMSLDVADVEREKETKDNPDAGEVSDADGNSDAPGGWNGHAGRSQGICRW